MIKTSSIKKEIISGILASVGLLLFYFVVMGLTSRSWSATVSQFRELWYWMIILAGGFGVQVGLYIKLKTQMLNLKSTTVVVSGTASSVSMIACCAHHLAEVLPIIGLSGAAIFLTRYQIPLIILGILMNLLGIFYMPRLLKKLNIKV